jgi:hypothetical protein
MLKISGSVDWKTGATYEAAWPGNLRRGGAQLVNCGKCSKGFAIRLGNIDGQTSGSLIFRQMQIDQVGLYKVTLTSARNFPDIKAVHVYVNNAPPLPAKALMREGNDITIPVDLAAGDNRITVSYAGKETFDIDKLRLFR